MAREIDLWRHLPPFLKNFKEMCGLIDTENPEFNLIAQQTDAMLDEMFIQTATDTGLSRYEKLLGISHASGDSLETRRSAIMTRWHDIVPYTMTVLRNRIIAIQGNDDVEIILTPDRPYELEIVTHLENPGQVNDLEYILRTMIPCNLLVRSVNMIDGETRLSIWYGLGASLTGTAFLTDDLKEDRTFTLLLGFAGSHGVTQTYFLTNDLNEQQTVRLESGVAIAQSTANTLMLTNDFRENVDIGGAAHAGASGTFTNIIEIH